MGLSIGFTIFYYMNKEGVEKSPCQAPLYNLVLVTTTTMGHWQYALYYISC